jgi:hypothetical protein
MQSVIESTFKAISCNREKLKYQLEGTIINCLKTNNLKKNKPQHTPT